VILSSEEGFEKTLSSEGCMWGKGLYFAEQASYSHNYSFLAANGDRQFFLAEIILGESMMLPSNTNVL